MNCDKWCLSVGNHTWSFSVRRLNVGKMAFSCRCGDVNARRIGGVDMKSSATEPVKVVALFGIVVATSVRLEVARTLLIARAILDLNVVNGGIT